jgi:very-short-patch-repair endonuclease
MGKRRVGADAIELAQSLRREQTEEERLLWCLLRGRKLGGFKFRRQHPLGQFVLDFYCPKARLAIELDGGVHEEAIQHELDRCRDLWFRARGIQVLRFTNKELQENPGWVLHLIQAILKS